MPRAKQYDQTIDDIERGDDAPITITAITAGSISGWSLQFDLSTDRGTSPVLTLTTASGITITDAGNGVFVVTLTAAQTKAIRRGLYRWSVCRTDSGTSYCIADGTVRFIDPTRSI